MPILRGDGSRGCADVPGTHSHPFTLANIPQVNPEEDAAQEMVLLIREASGLTQKLRSYLSRTDTGKTVPVLLDGPFGGLEGDLSIYEHNVLIAGGTGITFVLPVLQDLVQQMVYDEETTVCKSIDVIWSIKKEGACDALHGNFRCCSSSPRSACARLHRMGPE